MIDGKEEDRIAAIGMAGTALFFSMLAFILSVITLALKIYSI